MATPTAATPAPAVLPTAGFNPKIIAGGILLSVVLILSLVIWGLSGDSGPAWTKDPRFIHNTQQEAWEMK